jgi:hypothetical protein
MERYIGMDVHAASCTLAVISEKGRKLRDFPVETNGQALVEAVRMIPGHKHLVLEEGLQSAWLYETLSPHVDELVVAGITQSRGQKSDKRDAYALAEKLRVGNLDKPVFKAPRQFTRLREFSRTHMTLVGDVVRTQSRIKQVLVRAPSNGSGTSTSAFCDSTIWRWSDFLACLGMVAPSWFSHPLRTTRRVKEPPLYLPKSTRSGTSPSFGTLRGPHVLPRPRRSLHRDQRGVGLISRY